MTKEQISLFVSAILSRAPVSQTEMAFVQQMVDWMYNQAEAEAETKEEDDVPETDLGNH